MIGSFVRRPHHRYPVLESLEARNAPACFGLFDADGGQLWVVCDAADDRAVLSSDPAGGILLNGSRIPGDPMLANTHSLVMVGGDGNDWLDIHGLAGYRGSTLLYGGDGDDVLVGGAVGDILAGGDGRDHLSGGASSDLLFGGADGDRLQGNDGLDLLFGEDGDDYLVGGMDGYTDLEWGGAGADIFELDYACYPQPEERVADFQSGVDAYVTIVYIVDPCGHI